MRKDAQAPIIEFSKEQETEIIPILKDYLESELETEISSFQIKLLLRHITETLGEILL